MIYRNITRAEYEQLPGINWSSLKAGRDRLGAHIRAAKKIARADTPAFKLGRAIHQAILQPMLYASSWLTVTGKTTTKEGCLTEEDRRKIDGVATAWRTLDLRVTDPEMAVTWIRDGHACKAMIDCIDSDSVIDIKSTMDAGPRAFGAETYRLSYYGQLAWYIQGLRLNGMAVNRARLIAIEKEEPFAIGDYELTDDWIEAGNELTDDMLALYEDQKPASYGAQPLVMPSWAQPADDVTLTINGESVEV